MKPESKFLNKDKIFWANVRLISQEVGYTKRAGKSPKGKAPKEGEEEKNSTIKIPTLAEIVSCYERHKMGKSQILADDGKPTKFAQDLLEYFAHRASMLNDHVQHNLMNAEQAEAEFKKLRATLDPKCPIPMNKQKGDKRKEAFLTGMINMLIESSIQGLNCNYDPRSLTTITHENSLLRTLARRVDGSFPNTQDPIAIWEVKEYYYTTTFGSRVADGIYETLLDGMELEELWNSEKIKVHHYLFVDAHYTWWALGKSYLCRIIDLLHMGYVTEVVFGKEVLTEVPRIAKEWVQLYNDRSK